MYLDEHLPPPGTRRLQRVSLASWPPEPASASSSIPSTRPKPVPRLRHPLHEARVLPSIRVYSGDQSSILGSLRPPFPFWPPRWVPVVIFLIAGVRCGLSSAYFFCFERPFFSLAGPHRCLQRSPLASPLTLILALCHFRTFLALSSPPSPWKASLHLTFPSPPNLAQEAQSSLSIRARLHLFPGNLVSSSSRNPLDPDFWKQSLWFGLVPRCSSIQPPRQQPLHRPRSLTHPDTIRLQLRACLAPSETLSSDSRSTLVRPGTS